MSNRAQLKNFGSSRFSLADLEKSVSKLPQQVFRPLTQRKSLKKSQSQTLKKLSRSGWGFSELDIGNYSVQTKEKTWNIVGKRDPSGERPAGRNDILKLDHKVDLMMRRAERITQDASVITGAELHFEQDLMNIRPQIDEMLGPHPNHLRSRRENLAVTFYQQKWTDLFLAELEEMLSVSCLEQGRLLHKLRGCGARLFGQVADTLYDMASDLTKAWEKQEEDQTSMNKLADEQALLASKLQKGHDENIAKLQTHHEKEMNALKEEVQSAQQETAKMSETLRTLNGIFKQMRSDTNAVRQADLRDTCTKLEQELSERNAELSHLRPLPRQLHTARQECEELRQANGALQRELDNCRQQLAERNDMAEQVLRAESERLAEVERALQRYRERENNDELFHASMEFTPQNSDQAALATITRSNVNGNNGISSTSQRRPDTAASSRSILHSRSIGDPTSSAKPSSRDPEKGGASSSGVLCARCKQELDKIADVQDVLTADQNKHRKLCEGFRSLMPNIGFRPEKPIEWVLSCTRAIMHAKERKDAICQAKGLPLTRFPDFVYVWFISSSVERVSSDRRDSEKVSAFARADESRWSLYYGVKKFMREYAELRMFFELLDERNGIDEMAFVIHSLRAVGATVSLPLRWGTGVDAFNYEECMRQLADDAEKCTPEHIWMDFRDSTACAMKLLERSPPDVLVKLRQTLRSLAVPSDGRLTLAEAQAAAVAAGESANNAGSGGTVRGMCIDFGLFMTTMMKEYRKEQAHRRAAIRMMFTTATAANRVKLETHASMMEKEGKHITVPSPEELPVDAAQFQVIAEALSSQSTPEQCMELYREAYRIGKDKVCFTSFLEASERTQFFVKCLNLRPFYGTEYVRTLNEKQCASMSAIVHWHWRAFKAIVPRWTPQLCLEDKKELQMLVDQLETELESDGQDVHSDGRRPLMAYRRVLHFLNLCRILRRERSGEPGTMSIINEIQRELSVTEDIILSESMGDASDQREHLQRRKRLHSARLSGACTRIQRVWRFHLRLKNGVSPPLRSKMSKRYRPLLHHLERSMPWVLHQIADIYNQAVIRSISGEMLRTISLSDFIYDLFLRQYGVRGISERYLHDLFCTVRIHLGKHTRVKLFALMSGICDKDSDSLFSSPFCFQLYLHFLTVIHSTGGKTKDDSTESVLFRHGGHISGGKITNTKMPQCTISAKRARQAAQQLVASLSQKHQDSILGRVEALVRKDQVEMDNFLWVLMDEWAKDARERSKLLSRLEQSQGSCLHSYDEFVMALRSVDPIRVPANKKTDSPDEYHSVATENELVKAYSEAVRKSEQRAVGVDVECFIKIAQKYGFASWRVYVPVKTQPIGHDLTTQFWLLRQIWMPYKDPLRDLINMFKERSLSVEEVKKAQSEGKTGILSKRDTAALPKVMHHLRKNLDTTAATANIRQGGGAVVGTTWLALRQLLSNLHRCRIICQEGEKQLRDSWDD
eukprot:TRINITY_DN10421_c0_g1_i1.p1 TRINITY_DN10421_c0_g1~~TRINITY_DN10421_c0_g1_i1.p1  ORF type:complete len:1469 (+),score=337.82 TRINITY_DN10421_c0_g1_i1:120-4526(+)